MADPSRTVILGAHVGDRPVFWSENGPTIKLPRSRYLFTTSRERHNLTGPCNEAHCHIASGDKRKITLKSLEPDIPVQTTLRDLVSGHDAMMQAALDHLGSFDAPESTGVANPLRGRPDE